MENHRLGRLVMRPITPSTLVPDAHNICELIMTSGLYSLVQRPSLGLVRDRAIPFEP
jgi:hypothetical protein